jgi:hypothetical protein
MRVRISFENQYEFEIPLKYQIFLSLFYGSKSKPAALSLSQTQNISFINNSSIILCAEAPTTATTLQ